MEPIYQFSSGNDEYSPAARLFMEIEKWLRSQEAGQKEHGEIESFLSKEGTEVLRLLLQGYLDDRSVNEVKEDDVVGADGVRRTHRRRNCRQRLETLFGTVEVRRLGYSAPKASVVYPLDRELNLPPDKYSHGLRCRVAEEASKNSFDNAVGTILETTGGKVPKLQAEQLVVKATQDFEEFYRQGKDDDPEKTDAPLVMTMDGKGIVMRKDALREETRKRSEKQDAGQKARLGKGEKRNRKRMATVASVYTIERQPRTAQEIMGDDHIEPTKAKPKAQNKRVWASVAREPEQVTAEVFQEALRRDPEKKREWVVLVDGDERQIARIADQGERNQVDLTFIIDFIHVLEYLWKAAFCFFGPNSLLAEPWVKERALGILQGRSVSVAAAMRRSATMRQLNNREAVDKCANYLHKYKNALRYHEYLAAGLPIATGVIEGACRHLIKDRMDITGARWGLERAEAVLKLRSLRSSGDLQEYWTFHLAEELKRNHASHLEDLPLRQAA